MFEAFPKLTRFSHDWVVTEKIDGSNGAVVILNAETDLGELPSNEAIVAAHDGFVVLVQSRNRLIWPGKTTDHFGFAAFVKERAEDFVRLLGEGRHFGEWYGQGIGKRGYNIPGNAKRLALFNVGRWAGQELPERVDTVPMLFEGRVENFVLFDEILADLKANGSKLGSGFDNPEGIVMYHRPSKTLFKRTFDYDEAGKWAENQARKTNG